MQKIASLRCIPSTPRSQLAHFQTPSAKKYHCFRNNRNFTVTPFRTSSYRSHHNFSWNYLQGFNATWLGFASAVGFFGLSTVYAQEEKEESPVTESKKKGTLWINTPSMFIKMAYSTQLFLQRKAAQGIAYCTEKDYYAALVLRDGGLDALAHLVQIDDYEVQSNIFRALSSLSKQEPAKIPILENGWLGLFKIFSSKNAEEVGVIPQDEIILSYILSTLANLTSNTDPTILGLFEKNGGLSILYDYPRICFQTSPEIFKLKTLVAFSNLAKLDSMRPTLCEKKSMESLQLLAVSPSESVRIEVAKVISEIAKRDDLRLTIIQQGWLDNFKSWSASDNKQLRYYTASALAQLIENDSVALMVIRRFGMEMFTSLADVTDIDVQHTVEKAFATLKKRSKETDTSSNKEVYAITDDWTLYPR